MRILHLVPVIDDVSTYGGQVAVALAQCAELGRRGHQVRLVAGWRGAGDPPEEIERVPVTLFRVGASGTGPALARSGVALTAWLSRNAAQYDVAHLHLAREVPAALAAIMLSRAGLPFVVQTHGLLDPTDRSRSGTRRATWTDGWPLVGRRGVVAAVRGASRRLVGDPAERESIIELTGSAAGITLLRHGVPAVRPADRVAASGDPLDVLLVCRLHPDKGVLAFAELAAAVLDRGLDARFTVLGPDAGAGPALARHLADRPELAARFEHAGPAGHEQTVDRIRRADLFVLPPGDGAHSMALLEALSAAVPAICTTDYGHAVPLRAHHGIRVVRPTTEALAQAVVELAGDPVGRAVLGARGREAVQRAFGIGAVVDELESVYAQTLAEAEVQPALPRRAGTAAVRLAARRTGPDRVLVWVTSEVTAERLALWREVARLCDLTVGLIASDQASWRLLLDGAREPFAVVPLGSGSPAPIGGVARWSLDRSLRELVRRRPDAVVLDGWRSPAYAAAARLARRQGVAVVVTFGESAPGQTPAAPRAQRRLLRRADAVLTAGPAGMEAALGLGVHPDRIAVRPRPAVVDLRTPAASQPGSVGLPGRPRQSGHSGPVIDVREGHRFLYVGPLISRRQLEPLLRAFHLARATGDVLTACGSGPLRTRLSELATQLGIDPVVTFTADLDTPARSLALVAAHTVVVPGGYQPSARLVEEALAAGRHVVIGSGGGEAAVASTPGVFVAEPTPAGLSRAMVRSRQRWSAATAARSGGPGRDRAGV